MSLDCTGFDEVVNNIPVTIHVNDNHKLLKLAKALPWEDMLAAIMDDLKQTDKKRYWVGRPLRVRVHLGIFILQQYFDLKDRESEQQLRDNAVFRLFCGFGIVEKWHIPDHTKIETFRSRLRPETKRHLANLMAQQAVAMGFADPSHIDMDSTVQEANISFPTIVSLLFKVALYASTLARALNTMCFASKKVFNVNLSEIKQLSLHYYKLRKNQADESLLLRAKKNIWSVVYQAVLPVMNNLHLLEKKIQRGKYWNIRYAMERLRWRGMEFIKQSHAYLFEGEKNTVITSLHAYDVGYFNKGKLHKRVEFGRAFQLGRIAGNFFFVGECRSVYLPDAKSFPMMISLHQSLFNKSQIKSVATDKGYYAWSNEKLLKEKGVESIYLPRPERTLSAPVPTISSEKRKQLHNRRAGIEPLIAHTKQGGQLGKSRMKSDSSTKSAGYCAVLGFNLRQLARYLTGEIYLKVENGENKPLNDNIYSAKNDREAVDHC